MPMISTDQAKQLLKTAGKIRAAAKKRLGQIMGGPAEILRAHTQQLESDMVFLSEFNEKIHGNAGSVEVRWGAEDIHTDGDRLAEASSNVFRAANLVCNLLPRDRIAPLEADLWDIAEDMELDKAHIQRRKKMTEKKDTGTKKAKVRSIDCPEAIEKDRSILITGAVLTCMAYAACEALHIATENASARCSRQPVDKKKFIKNAAIRSMGFALSLGLTVSAGMKHIKARKAELENSKKGS